MAMDRRNISAELRWHYLQIILGPKTSNSVYYWNWRELMAGQTEEEIEAELLEDLLKNG